MWRLGLLRHSGGDESADKFVPLLIYVVLRANPESLVSNVQYILRFRNPDKLNGEAGYYLSSLMGAIQFIEGLDRSSLTITDEEFERNVEAAVAEIAERPPPPPLPPRSSSLAATNEKLPRIGIPATTPRSSSERDPRISTSSRESTDSTAITPDTDEKLAVAGLLRTIQRPLTTIGRMFTDDLSAPAAASGPARTPAPGNTPRGSPSAEDAAARQASAEAEEARKIERRGRENVVATLAAMFPNLDREVIGDVVRAKEGRLVFLFFFPSFSLLPLLYQPSTLNMFTKGFPATVSDQPSTHAWLYLLDRKTIGKVTLDSSFLLPPSSSSYPSFSSSFSWGVFLSFFFLFFFLLFLVPRVSCGLFALLGRIYR